MNPIRCWVHDNVDITFLHATTTSSRAVEIRIVRVVRSPEVDTVHRAMLRVARLEIVQVIDTFLAAISARFTDRSEALLDASTARDIAVSPVSPGRVITINGTVVGRATLLVAIGRAVAATILRFDSHISSLCANTWRSAFRNACRTDSIPIAPRAHLTRDGAVVSGAVLILVQVIAHFAIVLGGSENVASPKLLATTTLRGASAPSRPS